MTDKATDIADRAAETEAFFLELAKRNRRPEGPAMATGRCMTCDAELADSRRRWCDADCRDEWEAIHGAGGGA